MLFWLLLKDKLYPLKVIKITKIYNKFNIFKYCKKGNKPAIDNLSFNVENGECFGFIGGNAAGKSTTFKCLCKEIKPNNGLILINGIDINDYAVQKKVSIGYCPQFDSIFEHLTVEENLNFYGQLKGLQNLKALNESIMKKLDLLKFKYKKCSTLSGGNKRKVSVGISIMSQPDVIFMDEPSTGMDHYTRRLLMDLLNNGYLKNQTNKNDKNKNKNECKQKAIILTSHSLEEVESLCDTIGILVEGKMERERKGTINKLVQKYSKGIELNIEFKQPTSEFLLNEYKLDEKSLNETIKNKEGIKQFLYNIKKEKYYKLVK